MPWQCVCGWIWAPKAARKKQENKRRRPKMTCPRRWRQARACQAKARITKSNEKESNETTQGGGGLVPRCSDAHQARKQLMPVRLCACLSVCPTPRNEEAKIILCTQAKRRDELWMLPPYTLVVLVVVCPLSLGLVNMAPNCRLNFSPMDACVFVCVLV